MEFLNQICTSETDWKNTPFWSC